MDLEGLEISVPVLKRFNVEQRVAGVSFVVGSLLAMAAGFLFFWGVFAWTGSQFGSDYLVENGRWLAVALWVPCLVAGFFRAWRGQGALDYWDSIDTVIPREGTAGIVDYRVSQATAPAYVISQLIYAGPRWLLVGLDKFRKPVPLERSLADSMETLRRTLDAERGYKRIEFFADRLEALKYLKRMGIASIEPREERLMVRISLEAQTRRG